MELLERKIYIDDLRGLLEQAARGQGSMVFLGGEAGVGKTSVVRQFAEEARSPIRVLIGACEPLSTPRPHGPLTDMDELMSGPVGRLIEESAPPAEIARMVLAELAQGPPKVCVVEDAHWIDEATADALRFLGRRIATAPALVIVTFRNDEVGKNHPMRRLLGDLATASAVRRVHLSPLSLDGVTKLTEGTGLDPVRLYVQTNGNPFYVTEVIAGGAPGLPANVRDAVLARADRLSPDARHMLEVAAVAGSPVESWLVMAASNSPASAAEECISRGLLMSSGDSLVFRHELARNAVLESISPPQQVEFHRRILGALRDAGSTDLVRLAHHAAAAFDRDAVLEYGPAAAERAAAFQSHREAAAQYERVMQFAGALPSPRRAELLSAWSLEVFLMDQADRAIELCEEALDIWRAEGNSLREGDTLRWLAHTYWNAGRNAEAEVVLAAALALLESLPPGPELAMAYSARSQLHMLAWEWDAAIEWGELAIRLAEELNERQTLAHALANVGSALMMLPDHRDRADELIGRALEICLRENLQQEAARVYTLISTNRSEMYDFEGADLILTEGIAYVAERDIDAFHSYLCVCQGESLLYQGRWAEATEQSLDVLRRPELAPVSRIFALAVLGRVRVRQGDPAAAELLDEALELATGTGELQRLCPVRTARAERSWLAGDLEQVREEAGSIYERVLRSGHRWYIGQLAYWLWRANALDRIPEPAFEPFVLHIEGRWREAAAAWRERGCPYEAAWALMDSNAEAEMRYAHAEFVRLGAAPAAAIALHRLRALGAGRLPRGPRPTTRANPYHLTSRELEVLELLVQRRRTQDIAETLFLSPRTVGHHISAILTKLEVRSREEAAWKAVQAGIVTQRLSVSSMSEEDRDRR